MLPFLVPVLFTFYIQNVLKLKKNSGAKGLTIQSSPVLCFPLQISRSLTHLITVYDEVVHAGRLQRLTLLRLPRDGSRYNVVRVMII